MKKLTIPCNFGGQQNPVDFYIGEPKPDNHPIQNQSSWLSSERGGNVPPEIMESLQRLQDLSVKNKVPFEDLCSYAIDTAKAEENKRQDVEPYTNHAIEEAKIEGQSHISKEVVEETTSNNTVPDQQAAADIPADNIAEQQDVADTTADHAISGQQSTADTTTDHADDVLGAIDQANDIINSTKKSEESNSDDASDELSDAEIDELLKPIE